MNCNTTHYRANSSSVPGDPTNYLGWEDTLASHDNTVRQWAYAEARGENQVYTPQIMVDGAEHVVGSDRAAIDTAIAAASLTVDVPLSVTFVDGTVRVEVGAAPEGVMGRGTLWLVLYSQAETVTIGRGENAGRTVTYHNVVRGMNRIGMWRGEPMTIELPMAELLESGADGSAVLLQQEHDGGIGPIIGAAARERTGA